MVRKILTILRKSGIPLFALALCSMIFNKELINVENIKSIRVILLILLVISSALNFIDAFKKKS
jgi:hypothetical protein